MTLIQKIQKRLKNLSLETLTLLRLRWPNERWWISDDGFAWQGLNIQRAAASVHLPRAGTTFTRPLVLGASSLSQPRKHSRYSDSNPHTITWASDLSQVTIHWSNGLDSWTENLEWEVKHLSYTRCMAWKLLTTLISIKPLSYFRRAFVQRTGHTSTIATITICARLALSRLQPNLLMLTQWWQTSPSLIPGS